MVWVPSEHDALTVRNPGGESEGKTIDALLALVGSSVTDSGVTAVPFASTLVTANVPGVHVAPFSERPNVSGSVALTRLTSNVVVLVTFKTRLPDVAAVVPSPNTTT